jgi:hypothetical protein
MAGLFLRAGEVARISSEQISDKIAELEPEAQRFQKSLVASGVEPSLAARMATSRQRTRAVRALIRDEIDRSQG